jgi:hypothetical protein
MRRSLRLFTYDYLSDCNFAKIQSFSTNWEVSLISSAKALISKGLEKLRASKRHKNRIKPKQFFMKNKIQKAQTTAKICHCRPIKKAPTLCC